jgi:hypothetical protein
MRPRSVTPDIRSPTYLQPVESAGCVRRLKDHMTTVAKRFIASMKQPETIIPESDGSTSLSFPIMVQLFLGQRCASCYNAEKPEGGVVLTGEIDKHYTKSYKIMSLIPTEARLTAIKSLEESLIVLKRVRLS